MRKMVRFLFLTVLCIQLASCNTWFSSSNEQPAAPLPTVKPSLHIEKVWSSRPNRGTVGNSLKLAPTIVNGVLYTVDTKGKISALDAHTGKTLWQTDNGTNITTAAAVQSQSRLAVGTGYGQVIVYEPKHGKLVWFDRLSN